MPRDHRVVAVLALALAAFGCGGSSSESPAPATPSASDAPAEAEAPSASSGAETRLRLAQEQECGRMCPLLTRCAVVEGLANPSVSEEERAAFEDERTLEANTDMCLDACGETELSPRQVTVLQRCSAEMPAQGDPTADQCGGYLACLQQVEPTP